MMSKLLRRRRRLVMKVETKSNDMAVEFEIKAQNIWFRRRGSKI